MLKINLGTPKSKPCPKCRYDHKIVKVDFEDRVVTCFRCGEERMVLPLPLAVIRRRETIKAGVDVSKFA